MIVALLSCAPNAGAAQLAAPIHVEARALLDIGGANAVGPAQLARVRGVMRLAGGVIVVADAGSSELRYFTAAGGHIRTAAGRGSGPGEVEGFDAAVAVDDSIYAFDQRGPLVVFDSGGRYVRRIELGENPPGMTFGWPRGVMRGGAVAGLRWRMTIRTLGELQADSTLLVVKAASGGEERVLARYPRWEGFELRAGARPAPRAFSGDVVLATAARELCAGFSRTFDITCRDAAGRLTRRITMPNAERPVTEAMRSGLRRALGGIAPDGSQRLQGAPRTAREALARSMEFARTLPEFSRLLIARDDRLWVRIAEPEDFFPRWGGSPARVASRWRLFERSGERTRDVILPASFDLFDAGADWVLGVQWDEDDAEHVVMYRLQGARR